MFCSFAANKINKYIYFTQLPNIFWKWVCSVVQTTGYSSYTRLDISRKHLKECATSGNNQD